MIQLRATSSIYESEILDRRWTMDDQKKRFEELDKNMMVDIIYSESRSEPADIPIVEKRTNQLRRDVSDEKSPASLDEIHDLYSALQDLVKNHSSEKPIELQQSPRMQAMKDCSSTPEYISSSTTSTPASSRCGSTGDCFEDIERSSLRHRRGISLDISPFKSKNKSPLSPRKSSEPEVLRRINRSSSTSGLRSNKKKEDSPRSNKKEGKKGWNLRLKIRSRSQAQLYVESVDGTSDEGRRRSDSFYNRETSVSSLDDSIRRRGSTPGSGKLEELVASLEIQTNGSSVECSKPVSTSQYKCPKAELSKLECWFEKAAAEAMKQQKNESPVEVRRSSPKKTHSAKRDRKRGQLSNVVAKSAPNLLDENIDDELQVEANNKRNSMKLMRNQISFDEVALRFPKSPIFYTPDIGDKRKENNDRRSYDDSCLITSTPYFDNRENVRKSIHVDFPTNDGEVKKDDKTLWTRLKNTGIATKEKTVQKVRKVRSTPRQKRK